MKHRSPLVTLGAAVLWFATMLTINLVLHPAGGSAQTGPAPSSAAATTAPPGEPPSGPPSGPPSPPSPPPLSPPPASSTAAKSTFPNEVVYAGRTKDRKLAVAIAILNGKAAAYICDGRSVEAWLRGSTDGDVVTLGSRTGWTIQAKLDNASLEGTIRWADKKYEFAIAEAEKPAGLYRAKGSKTTIGWIVLSDGTQVGVAATGDDEAPAPTLDPDAGSVTLDGEDVKVESISGDSDVEGARTR